MAAKKKTAKKAAKKTTPVKAKAKTTTAARATGPRKSVSPSSKVRTKGEILSALADSTGLARKEIASVVEALAEVIAVDIGGRGPGIFALPGLLKIMKIHKPATKARKGVNPFTGEPTVFKAKPARNIVKVRPLKGLKSMV